MSGDKMRHGGGGAGYSYKEPAAGGPAGYAAPPAAAGAPGYGAPPGYAPPQRHYAQPQPQSGFHAYPQQHQMPPPNVVYGMPPPTASYNGYPQQQPGFGQQQPGFGQQQPGFQQPVGAPPMQMQMMPPGQWTTGLFDFGEDPNNCVITFFFPCITFGQIAEVVDQGTTSCLLAASMWMAVFLCFWAPCLVSCLWRTKLRAKYNIPQDEIGDVCIHFWCEPCALCQEYRELNNRGLNPALGWEYHRQQMYAQSMQAPMGAPQHAYMQR